MQMQNKNKHLHYLVCLGSGLRKANSDITSDALPEQMQMQLRRLAHGVEERSGSSSSGEGKPTRPR